MTGTRRTKVVGDRMIRPTTILDDVEVQYVADRCASSLALREDGGGAGRARGV
jgi:hypothetical protein